jgi:hypothetical protein
VIGILGSGAVWHFISSKQYHVAIWVGFSGLVLLFLVIALYLRNELLKAEEFWLYRSWCGGITLGRCGIRCF